MEDKDMTVGKYIEKHDCMPPEINVKHIHSTGLDVIWEWGKLDSAVYHQMTNSLLRIRKAMEKSILMRWFNPLRLIWIINIHIQSFQLRRLYIYLGKLKDVYLLHMELPYKEKEE